MITSVRGTLREGVSVYRQLSERAITGEPNSFEYARVSPTAWQSLYGEAQILRGAQMVPYYGGLKLVMPMGGKNICVVADATLDVFDFEICDYFRG